LQHISLHDKGPGGVGPNSTRATRRPTRSPALWNYAQKFAMRDNSFGTTFGPSKPGAIDTLRGIQFEGTIQMGSSANGKIAGAAAAVCGGNLATGSSGDVCSNRTDRTITTCRQKWETCLQTRLESPRLFSVGRGRSKCGVTRRRTSVASWACRDAGEP